MSNYINDLGVSSGPISIGPQGNWISNNLENNINSLKFTQGKNSKDYLQLIARTPILSNDINSMNLNAVATIGWVLAYNSLNPGSIELDMDSFASKTDLYTLKNTVASQNTLILKNQSDINDIQEQVLRNELGIAQNRNLINKLSNDFNNYKEIPYPEGVWLKCGKA